NVAGGTLVLEATGSAKDLHKLWKISQNTLEYLSGIATYTKAMVQKAQQINPHAKIVTTRKNFPMTKELSIDAIIAGGATPHRLGLYDSVLVFEQHLNFLPTKEELEKAFFELKSNFMEKKIVVEVDNYESARYFATLGADVLQCEKMTTDELRRCVTLKSEFPYILISATGGVKLENVDSFAACGVDLIVTSAPYHAKPLDIKVKIFPWETL
ncbi:MAG: ModD protein, partial [Sulfurimonadaceae bacterium]|nr:ModD protein [Sulfurimonadaceae bacterium]